MPDPSQQSDQQFNSSPAQSQTDDSSSMPNLSFDTGSSAPPPTFPNIIDEPKKIYGGDKKGRIVATILGIFALIGSVSAGAYLALNNQNPNEKAAEAPCSNITSSVECGKTCSPLKGTPPTSFACKWLSATSKCVESAQTCGGSTTPVTPDEVSCPAGTNTYTYNGAGYFYCGGCVDKCVRTDLLASGGCNVYVSNKCGTPIQYGGVKCVKAPTPALAGEKCNVQSGSGYDASYNTHCPDGASFDKTGFCYHRTSGIEDGLCATYPGCLGTVPNATPGTTPLPALEYTCNSNGCSVKTGSYPACGVIKYTCTGTAQISGCSQNPQGPAQSYTFDTNLCGKTQQIDVVCQGVSKNFVTNVYPACAVPTPKPPVITPPPTPSPSPTPMPVAQCQNVTAYSPTWTALTATQLSQKKAGDLVNFCVVGSASAGIFDKAMFTINNIAMPETTVKRPNTQDFCQSYTIPVGTYVFKVKAQIHHVTLGWK